MDIINIMYQLIEQRMIADNTYINNKKSLNLNEIKFTEYGELYNNSNETDLLIYLTSEDIEILAMLFKKANLSESEKMFYLENLNRQNNNQKCKKLITELFHTDNFYSSNDESNSLNIDISFFNNQKEQFIYKGKAISYKDGFITGIVKSEKELECRYLTGINENGQTVMSLIHPSNDNDSVFINEKYGEVIIKKNNETEVVNKTNQTINVNSIKDLSQHQLSASEIIEYKLKKITSEQNKNYINKLEDFFTDTEYNVLENESVVILQKK